MNIFSRIFGRKKKAQAPAEHSVIVHFQYGSTDLSRLLALERKLEAAIDAAGAGEHDGHEINVDGSDGYLYMYGPDADRLFEAVRPVLQTTDFTRGATATVRYGPPDPDTPQKQAVIEG